MAVVDAALAADSLVPRRGGLTRFWGGLVRQPIAFTAGLILLVIFLGGAIVPSFASHGSLIDLSSEWRNHAPTVSEWHLFGTNGIGQDVLLRTIYGLHTSEQTALFATLLATLIGTAAGGIAAFRGGWLDVLLMRLADMLGVFPALILLLAAWVLFTPVTILKSTVILACYLWVPVARVVRGEIASLRNREFVHAAIASGASDRRIFFRHLLPNAGSTVVVAASALFGQMIMLEATIEFFGLGVTSEESPTLGNLIGDGQLAVITQGWGWWVWAGPANVLVVILVCANLVGDGVADALRPTRRR